jgi:hypothetical protein
MVESSWNVMAHGEAGVGKWRGNWRMGWVASTLHTTSEHCVSSIHTADAHSSAAGSRLNWRPRRFEWTRPFRRKTKSGFCACAITFQTQSTRRVVKETASPDVLKVGLWVMRAPNTQSNEIRRGSFWAGFCSSDRRRCSERYGGKFNDNCKGERW